MKIFKLSGLAIATLCLIQSAYAVETLPLHSFTNAYTLVFTGKVKAGSASVADRTVRIRAHISSQDRVVQALGKTSANGSYRVELVLNDYQNEMVDWTLDAGNEESALEGRCILGTNLEITMEKTLRIKPAAPVLVVLR